jgi:uncharacterized cupredoxin-like copper-binding protein
LSVFRKAIAGRFIAIPGAGATCILIGGLLFLTSCGGGSGTREIAVVLDEWSITPAVESLKGGRVRFAVKNDGERTHEIVLVKSDLPPHELPLLEGRVDASKINLERMPSLRLDGGASGRIGAALSPGKYVLLCNIVESAPVPASHYENGMYAALFIEP